MDGVIEGSVQRENGRVKVMIQLIHGPTDTHLWARGYEHELTDLLKLQGEMARAIADEIRIEVTPEVVSPAGFCAQHRSGGSRGLLARALSCLEAQRRRLEAGYWPLRAGDSD